jgi:hypothetical protein
MRPHLRLGTEVIDVLVPVRISGRGATVIVKPDINPAPTDRSCRGSGVTSKKTFESAAEAKRAIRILLQRGEHGLNAYRCQTCRRFHVGHKTR